MMHRFRAGMSRRNTNKYIVLAGLALISTSSLLAGSAAMAKQTDEALLNANKKLVLDFFRVVFEAQNISAAKDYLREDYIQHNPKVPSGREGFVNYFGSKWKEPKAVKSELEDKPVDVIAEGNFVSLMWKYQKDEPNDKAKKYDAYWFDMFRIQDGKIAEHWDNALK
jgi:predicted SnoaL-like aldol condensation-catalyzing enzyme